MLLNPNFGVNRVKQKSFFVILFPSSWTTKYYITCGLYVSVWIMTINTNHYFVQVEQLQQHLEESKKTLQEQIFKLEAQKIQLEEVRFGFIYGVINPFMHCSGGSL